MRCGQYLYPHKSLTMAMAEHSVFAALVASHAARAGACVVFALAVSWPCAALSQVPPGSDSAIDSLDLELPVDINFDLNFRPMTSESSPKSLFLGAESLPQTYVDGDEAPRLTLRPYTCFTRYDEDPIRWQTMASLMNPPRVTGRDIYVPFTIHGFGRATSGGAGTSFTFSMEDVLLSIFSKTYRYRKHNAKHATAWKNYLEPGL